MDAWWSEATKLPFATQNGGAYIGGPFQRRHTHDRVQVLHTIDHKLLWKV